MTHLVVRPMLDVVVRDAGGGLAAERAVLDRLGTLWTERLLPILDAVCSEVAGPDRTVRVDRLELDLGTLPPDGLDDAFAEAFRDALHEALHRETGATHAAGGLGPASGDGRAGRPPEPAPPTRATPPAGDVDRPAAGPPETPAAEAADGRRPDSPPKPLPPSDRRRDPSGAPPDAEPIPSPEALARAADALAVFLATGRLPWWADRPGAFDLDAAAVRLAAAGRLAGVVAQAGPVALRRLAWQSHRETVAAVLRAWTPHAAAVEAAVAAWRPVAVARLADPARADATLRALALATARPGLADPALRSAAASGPASATEQVARIAVALLAAAPGTATPTDRDALARAAETLRARAAVAALTPTDRAPLDAAATALAAESGPSPSTQADAPDAPTAARPDATTPPPPSLTPTASPTVGADEPLYVRDAGLVLLAPFLRTFFETLGLLDPDRRGFADDEAARRAVALTASLATARGDHAEPELVLAKVLCGLPIETPAPREITRTDAETAEAEALLTAVIGHWPPVRGTSLDGFRATFLLREGRLTRGAEAWALTIERRGVDVLVDQVPWGIGLVALPWMPAPLHVTW